MSPADQVPGLSLKFSAGADSPGNALAVVSGDGLAMP